MSLKKKAYYGFSFLLAFLSLYYLVNIRALREFQRCYGFLEDKYISMSLEQSIEEVSTWGDAEYYLMSHLRFDKNQCSLNAKVSYETGRSLCFGSSMIAKELLSDNKNQYEVELYVFENRPNVWSHMIAVVKDRKTQTYGSLGINASDCIAPKYKSKEKIFKKIKKTFFWKAYKNPEKVNI